MEIRAVKFRVGPQWRVGGGKLMEINTKLRALIATAAVGILLLTIASALAR